MIVGTRTRMWGLLLWQWKSIALFAATSAVVVVCHLVLRYAWLRIPALPIAVVGGALGIFVSFRTNAAYARWWEGRGLWGRLINTSRMFATQVMTYLPEGAPRRALLERHILYVHVLRCLLREQDPWSDPDVQRFSTEETRAAVKGESNVTHALLHLQQETLVAQANAGALTDLRLDAFDRTIAALLDVQGGCERIKRTPMPRIYGLFSEQLTKAYGFLFPLAVVVELKWATIPVNILVCTAFMMISEVGRILEDPFTMFFNGLPLSALSRTIENNIRNRLGDTKLEPMLQPNEYGVLM